MTATVTFDAIVSSNPEPHMLDSDRGIIFWVRTSPNTWTEDVQVFLPVSRAELVDEVDLSIGAKLQIEGEQLENGIVVAATLAPSLEPSMAPEGRLLGTVDIHIPALSRLNPWRQRRYQLTLWGGIAAVLVSGIIGMTTGNVVGNAAFPLFLAFCAWMLVDDLRTRRVDNREYGALARTAAEAIQASLNIQVPEVALLTLLGGGLERTGNPWNPNRPRQPQSISWGSDLVSAMFYADIAPKPLQPNSIATIAITVIDGLEFDTALPNRS